jgi:hypothetical protein
MCFEKYISGGKDCLLGPSLKVLRKRPRLRQPNPEGIAFVRRR